MSDTRQAQPSGKTQSIRTASICDVAAISALHARAFGPGRFSKTAYRARKGAPLISPYCHVCHVDGALAASVRMTEIEIGGKTGALLLGPLAVDPEHANAGYGRALINVACEAAQSARSQLVILVGDEPYYQRCGFRAVAREQISFPGPVDPNRILSRELKPDALAEFAGPVSACKNLVL